MGRLRGKVGERRGRRGTEQSERANGLVRGKWWVDGGTGVAYRGLLHARGRTPGHTHTKTSTRHTLSECTGHFSRSPGGKGIHSLSVDWLLSPR